MQSSASARCGKSSPTPAQGFWQVGGLLQRAFNGNIIAEIKIRNLLKDRIPAAEQRNKRRRIEIEIIKHGVGAISKGQLYNVVIEEDKIVIEGKKGVSRARFLQAQEKIINQNQDYLYQEMILTRLHYL